MALRRKCIALIAYVKEMENYLIIFLPQENRTRTMAGMQRHKRKKVIRIAAEIKNIENKQRKATQKVKS